MNYLLDGKKIVPCHDVLEWAKKFEFMDRAVSKTALNYCDVSTVFLGVDHSHFGIGPHILFETMIFGGEHDQYQERYSTWDEAEKRHNEIVEAINNGTFKGDDIDEGE